MRSEAHAELAARAERDDSDMDHFQLRLLDDSQSAAALAGSDGWRQTGPRFEPGFRACPSERAMVSKQISEVSSIHGGWT